MNAATIIGSLITGLAAILAAILTYRASRANNTAAPYSELAKDIVELRQDYRRLSDRVALVEGRDRRWSAAWDDLTLRWDHHREQPTPPPPPEMAPLPVWIDE